MVSYALDLAQRNCRTSEAIHRVQRGPRLSGLGNRPSLTRLRMVDSESPVRAMTVRRVRLASGTFKTSRGWCGRSSRVRRWGKVHLMPVRIRDGRETQPLRKCGALVSTLGGVRNPCRVRTNAATSRDAWRDAKLITSNTRPMLHEPSLGDQRQRKRRERGAGPPQSNPRWFSLRGKLRNQSRQSSRA